MSTPSRSRAQVDPSGIQAGARRARLGVSYEGSDLVFFVYAVSERGEPMQILHRFDDYEEARSYLRALRA